MNSKRADVAYGSGSLKSTIVSRFRVPGSNLSIALIAVSPVPVAAGHTAKDAISLLASVGKRNADGRSYRIESVEEFSQTSKLERKWNKMMLKAAAAPGGRYRYEGRSADGEALVVSDGTTTWVHHVEEHLYTQTIGSPERSRTDSKTTTEEAPIEAAKQLVNTIHWLTTNFVSASLLPDEKLELNGQALHCYVVQISDADHRFHKPHAKVEDTIWIDKSRDVIVKMKERREYSFRHESGTRPRTPARNVYLLAAFRCRARGIFSGTCNFRSRSRRWRISRQTGARNSSESL